MEANRTCVPAAGEAVLLEEPPKEGFSFYRDLIEELDRHMEGVFIPARFLYGDAPGEAGGRPAQRGEEPIEHLLQVVRTPGREHG